MLKTIVILAAKELMIIKSINNMSNNSNEDNNSRNN